MTNDIIDAQELMYLISKKKNKNGAMIEKLDLAKAYDRLDWHFLK